MTPRPDPQTHGVRRAVQKSRPVMLQMTQPVWVQVVHMGALHMLFASLAFMAAGRESHTPRLPASRGALQHTGPLEAFSALWHYNEVPFVPFGPAHHFPDLLCFGPFCLLLAIYILCIVFTSWHSSLVHMLAF